MFSIAEITEERKRIKETAAQDEQSSPAWLMNRLESSSAGCEWLLERWGEVRNDLEVVECWLPASTFTMVLLMGRQPMDALAVPEVALVVLAGHTIDRERRNLFMQLRSELSSDDLQKLREWVSAHARSTLERLKSKAFRDWLVGSYRYERSEFPSERAVARVLSSLEARARFDRGLPAMHVRVARAGDRNLSGAEYYVDLGDESGQAVKVSAQEWSVVDRPPVPFRRAGGLLPLPLPCRGGSIERLRAYVNVSEADFRLLVGWMATALLPEGPYPVLAIHGEQGSAKSTLARVIRLLIDPQSSPVLAQPRSTRDLMVTACGGWLLVQGLQEADARTQ